MLNSPFFLLFVAMFAYLIATGAFPKGLLPGVAIQPLLALLVPLLYSTLVAKTRRKA